MVPPGCRPTPWAGIASSIAMENRKSFLCHHIFHTKNCRFRCTKMFSNMYCCPYSFCLGRKCSKMQLKKKIYLGKWQGFIFPFLASNKFGGFCVFFLASLSLGYLFILNKHHPTLSCLLLYLFRKTAEIRKKVLGHS